jgi:chromosome segregation ATPase
MHAKLEREVQDLKAKLADQEAKTSAANAKAIREKNKRRTAREQRDEWKAKHAAEQKSNEAARAEHIKEEEGREDWKSMLFRQERRTEEYKLKYIALKDERKAWEARSVEQENTIVDWKTKFLDQEKEAMTLKTELHEVTQRQVVMANSELSVESMELQAIIAGLNQELEDRKDEREASFQELRNLRSLCGHLNKRKRKLGAKRDGVCKGRRGCSRKTTGRHRRIQNENPNAEEHILRCLNRETEGISPSPGRAPPPKQRRYAQLRIPVRSVEKGAV